MADKRSNNNFNFLQVDETIKTVEIRKVDSRYAKDISEVLLASGGEYSKYFIPFEFNYNSVKKVLSGMKLDHFIGIFIDDKIVGFYMLRGFDEGYSIPSYGVWISPKYSGLGLAKLTIQHALSFCKINGIKKIMLKVHPKNMKAKQIYEGFGFINNGIDRKNNNLVYYKNIS